MKNLRCLIGFFIIVLCFSCNTETAKAPLSPEEFAKDLQRQLIEAKEGTTIAIPEGKYEFKRPLSFNDIPKVTIKGAGKGKTILSFKDQVEGGEGMIIKSADGVTLEGFTVQDSKGDAIKIQDSKDVIMRDLEATWTNGKKNTNGAYGLYPVSCTNVLMEKCEASYAMDAGIYVGQTKGAVVRNNYAHHNVAGIEIENTLDADVYDNKMEDNAGGLLIFDMPDLPVANGGNVKIHDNIVINNNGENFSSPGITVNILPPGTGLLVMAHKDVDIYNNTISGHNTVSLAVNSWQFTGRPFKSKEYDPFCHNIHMYDNKVKMGQGPTDNTTEFGKLFTALLKGQPLGIAFDGIVNPAHLNAKGALKDEHRICFTNNGELPFINLNAYKAIDESGLNMEKLAKAISTDMSPFECKKEL